MNTTFVNFGNTKIELLEPLGDNTPIAGFLEKNPRGGFHHFCYEVYERTMISRHYDLKVDNLSEVVKKLKEHGITPLAPPKIGAHGFPVIFLHPKHCNGMLTEFEEVPSSKQE